MMKNSMTLESAPRDDSRMVQQPEAAEEGLSWEIRRLLGQYLWSLKVMSCDAAV